MAIHPARNLGLKLMSVAMAVCLWFIVAREETSEAVLRTQVEFVNVPSRLEITGDPPSHVDIRIRASTTLMRRVNETGLTARVDLRTAKPGVQRVVLDASIFDLPLGCQVIRINPPDFKLELEEKESRLVLVSPRIEGRTAEGFEIVSLGTTPSRVLVEGPASRVRRLSAVTTESVSVEGLVTSLSQRVALKTPDPACRLVEDTTSQLDITIVEKEGTRVIEGVVVELAPGSPAASFSPQRVRVEVQGAASRLRLLSSHEMRARVDVSGLSPGAHVVAPQIVFSSQSEQAFRVLSVDPEGIRVGVPGQSK